MADVGIDEIAVHDAHREDPSLAFSLSRLSNGPYGPTPIGVFRDVDRPTYGELVEHQILAAQERHGPGDLAPLFAPGSTWTVG